MGSEASSPAWSKSRTDSMYNTVMSDSAEKSASQRAKKGLDSP